MRSVLRKIVRPASVAGALVATCLVSGCGGAKGATGSSTTGGETRKVRGQEVSVEAHNHWVEGKEIFDRAEKQGWNESACDDAMDAFEEASDLQEGFAEAEYMVAAIHDRCGDHAEAMSGYKKVLQMDPKFCKARVAIGLDHKQQGREAAAEREFARSVRDDPQCTEGYVNLAIMQRKRGPQENGEALNNLRRALAIESQYLPAFNEMALLYLSEASDNRKKLDLAEVVCSQAQKIDKDYPAIYNTWGLIDLRRNEIIDAAAKFEKAFTLDPKMFEAYMNFARITLGFRGYQDAKDAFQKALELRPKSFEARLGLGIALRGLGENQAAIKAYEAAMKLDPRRPEPYFNLGVLYQDFMDGTVEDMKTARKYYDQFLAKAGGDKRYAEAVEEVTRKCRRKTKSRRRLRRITCMAGRKQNIEQYIRAMKEMAEAERMQAEMQRRLKEQERREAEQKAREEAQKQKEEAGQQGEQQPQSAPDEAGQQSGGAGQQGQPKGKKK